MKIKFLDIFFQTARRLRNSNSRGLCVKIQYYAVGCSKDEMATNTEKKEINSSENRKRSYTTISSKL